MSHSRIYLDNAATSWPKPEAVYAAVDRYQRHSGAPAGRSVYSEAIAVQQAVEAARQAVARLLGIASPRQVLFTSNGTQALNLAIQGLVERGNHVVTSVVEHNSVLRPLRHLQDAANVEVTRVPCDGAGVVDPAAIAAALRPHTRLVILSHASNVTGAIQDVAAVGELCNAHGAWFLVDAAQTIGHLPCDVAALRCDLLAAPGHKGLLGPLGTGLLYVRPGIEQHLKPLHQGGTGSRSDEDRQPDSLPDKYESGNLNVPGIVGLGAGVSWLLEQGLESLRQHEAGLAKQLLEGLSAIEGVRCFGPGNAQRQVGVVACTLAGYDPQEVAALLDAARQIQVRAGFHCAPLMHRALGTSASGGALRFSLGPFNTQQQIAATLDATRELMTSAG